jgi:hypothetical protein
VGTWLARLGETDPEDADVDDDMYFDLWVGMTKRWTKKTLHYATTKTYQRCVIRTCNHFQIIIYLPMYKR